jgi:hypothetical protein
MKLFTDPDGKFQILVPIEWEYKNPILNRQNNEPHAFGMYDDMVGAFQLSCKFVTTHLEKVIKENNLPVQTTKAAMKFKEVFVEVGKTQSYMWMAAVEDHFVFATYILEGNKRKLKKSNDELVKARESLYSFKFIKPEFKDKVLSIRRYHLFMASIAATIDLRNKAMDNGSFIELVVLTANRIDALLRLSLILANQLEQKNDDIDVTILFQDEQDKVVMERKIYETALNRQIIDQSAFDELELLYKERNKVIHRYIITDIKTQHVLKIAYQYYLLEQKIEILVNAMEQKQFELKIGINATDQPPGNMPDELFLQRISAAIRDKHGQIKWKTG